MMVLSNTTAITLAAGEALPFNQVLLRSGCCECFNTGLSNSVKLKGPGIWILSFSGNITSGTADDVAQLSLAIAGQPLAYTNMTRTITTANNYENVATSVGYGVSCDDLSRVSVVNTGTTTITVNANAVLTVAKRQ